MNRLIKISAIVIIIVSCFAVSGCSASKKGQCGCPNKQGIVGYK